MFKTLLSATVLGALAVSSLPAQHTTVLRSWDRASRITYNDIWGLDHKDPVTGLPTGRSFVIVGETRGIWLLETTDPNNIVQVKWWSAPSSTWRDFTNIGNYFYAATENRTQRGFRVIDLTDPDNVVDHGYVQTSTMVSAHNVSADLDNGLLYFSGSNLNVAIYDVKTTPANPTLIGRYRGASYTHDLCIRRNRGYFALGRDYQVRILNVSNPLNITTIGNANTPGGYAHNAWVSDDDQIMVATDEISRNGVNPHMTLWNISNPAAPIKTGDYDIGSNFIVHNAFIMGRTAYMSHYGDGIHVVDLTNAAAPDMIARYDTSSSVTGYNGAWGCYPFEDSGVIYGSDLGNGLFALQIDRGHMNRYETGTAGSNGLVPRARFDGASPRVNASTLRIECENLEPNRNAWIVISSAQGAGTVLGASVHVDIAAGRVIGPFTADAQGKFTIPAPVPNDNSLAGGKVYMQLFSDLGTGSLSSSKGMWTGISAL